MSFPCSRCGACCRDVRGVPALAHLATHDGSCLHLLSDMACAVYEARPSVCRVDASQPSVMTQAEWYRRNHDACERLHLQVYGAPMPERAA